MSSINAATDVLKCQRDSKSSVILPIVWCSLRRAFLSSGRSSPLRSAEACARSSVRVTNRYTRERNRFTPSTPPNCQSRSFSGGAANSANSRAVSVPYFSAISSALTTLPSDFDILAPSLITIPCVNSRSTGSSFDTSPRSRITFVKNRE